MPAWFNFNPRFYLVALVFLIFDVEITLMYPVVVVFKRWVVQGHAGRAVRVPLDGPRLEFDFRRLLRSRRDRRDRPHRAVVAESVATSQQQVRFSRSGHRIPGGLLR